MSLIVDKDAVMEDVMFAINKHYAGYEKNLSEMENIIKKLPLVQQLIKENKELKERLESENIHIDVNEKRFTVNVGDDITKEMEKSAISLKQLQDTINMNNASRNNLHHYTNSNLNVDLKDDRGLEDTSPEEEEEEEDRGLGDTSPEEEEEEEEEEDRGLEDTSPEEEEDRGLGDTSPEEEEEEEDTSPEEEDRGLGDTSPEEEDRGLGDTSP